MSYCSTARVKSRSQKYLDHRLGLRRLLVTAVYHTLLEGFVLGCVDLFFAFRARFTFHKSVRGAFAAIYLYRLVTSSP
jgi:hypothetical protein